MVTEQELRRIAKLSRLGLEDVNLSKMLSEFSNIKNMIEELRVIDTEDVKPLYSVSDFSLPMFEDLEKKENSTEDLFKNIPKSEDSFAKEIKCYITPKVVE